VHGGHPAQWKEIVHHREHAFLHLTAVPGAADHLYFLGQIENGIDFGIETMFLPFLVGCLGAVHDDKVRLTEILQFLVGRAQEHVLDKVRLPGNLHNEPHLQPCIGIGAAEGIDNKQALAGELFGRQCLQIGPDFWSRWFVVVRSLG